MRASRWRFRVLPVVFGLITWSCGNGLATPAAPSEPASTVSRLDVGQPTGDTDISELDSELDSTVDPTAVVAARSGSITGIVKDSKGPVSGAKVTIVCGGKKIGKTITTTGRGTYTVNGVPAGVNCKVTVEHSSYAAQSRSLVVKSGKSSLVNFVLKKKDDVLPCDPFKLYKYCDAKYWRGYGGDNAQWNRCYNAVAYWVNGGCKGKFPY